MVCPAQSQNPQETPENGTDNAAADDADNHDEATGDEDDEDEEGDPVDVSSGAFRYSKTVLERPGRGSNFRFDLQYLSSAWTMQTRTAARWCHNFEQRIVLNVVKGPIAGYGGPVDGPGGGEPGDPFWPLFFSVYHYHNLKIDRYTEDPDTSALWLAPTGNYKKLRMKFLGGTQEIDRIPTEISIRGSDGSITYFDLREGGSCYFLPHSPYSQSSFTYRPSRFVDKHGNTIHLNYIEIPRAAACPSVTPSVIYRRLQSIEDTFGQLTTLQYDSNGWLDTITGPTGRVVSLEHDLIGNLTGLTLPPTGAQDSTYEFQYSPKNGSDPNSGHNIVAIIAPNEINDGSMEPYVQNIYDDALEFRVVRQIYGGTNATGVASGGTHDFIYEFQPQFPQQYIHHAWFDEKSRTLTIDPNGNAELKIYDRYDRLRLIYKLTGRLNHLADPLNPPTIASLVSYDVGWPTEAGPFATANLIAPDEPTIGSFQPATPCVVIRRDYNAARLLSRELKVDEIIDYVYGSSSEDQFQAGNLILERRTSTDDPSETIERAFAYEPFFNQIRTVYDPRGFESGTAPNGGAITPERYSTQNYFDFQEDSDLAELDDDAVIWDIDTVQAEQTSFLTALGISTAGPIALNLGDLNGDTNTTQRVGNVVATETSANVYVDPTQPGLGFEPQTIRREYRFNAHSNKIHEKDPRDNETSYFYFPDTDPLGQGASSGVTTGSGLLQRVELADGSQEAFGYDGIGRRTSVTNARGFATSWQFTDQSRLASETTVLGEATTYTYDGNGNNTQVQVDYYGPDIDTNGIPAGTQSLQGVLHKSMTYDILGRLLRREETVDTAGNVRTTTFRYDRNGNEIACFNSLWTNGSGHLTTRLYDELDRSFSTTRGGVTSQFVGLAAHSDVVTDLSLAPTGQEVSEFDHYEAWERTSSTDGRGHPTTYGYDGFGRLDVVTSPSGIQTRRTRNAAGQITRVETYGDDGQGVSRVLNRRTLLRDEVGRVFNTIESHFRFDTGLIGDGNAEVRTRFDAMGNSTRVVDDTGDLTERSFDTRNRLLQEIDPAGNQVSNAFDPNGNLIQREELEIDPSGASETFTTHFFYDQRDRQIAEVRPGLETRRWLYDSFGGVRFSSDARSSDLTVPLTSLDAFGEHDTLSGTTNGHGNTTERHLDFAGREITRTHRLRQGGLGNNPILSSIGVVRTYDILGRPYQRFDGNLNPTTTVYDDLGRVISTTFADGTVTSFLLYDGNDNLLQKMDARGNVVTRVYDLENRLETETISLAGGVGGTSFREFSYDGLSRTVRAETADTTVWRTYDSLSQLIREEIGFGAGATAGTSSEFVYDGERALTSIRQPGGRTVSLTRDELGRIDEISDQLGLVARYHYVGPARMERREDLLAGSEWELEYDARRRVTASRHTWTSTSTIFDDRVYDWDRAANLESRQNVIAGVTVDYDYDSINRLIDSDRVPGRLLEYALDDVGNRSTLTIAGVPLSYTMVGADALVNQYTTTPNESRAYDLSGNLADVDAGAKALLEYDFESRMVEYQDVNNGKTHLYTYDAFGRRVQKIVDAYGTPSTIRYFYAPGERVIEEQDDSGQTLVSYVNGRYVDELINARRPDGRSTLDVGYHSDVQFNTVKLTESGVIVAAYDYGDYGNLQHELTGGSIPPTTLCDHYFTGRRYDPETRLYFYRSRYMDPSVGRFLSRDRIGIWGDEANLGNGKSYVGNNPWSRLDPTGRHNWQELTSTSAYLKKGVAANATQAVDHALDSAAHAVGAGADLAQGKKGAAAVGSAQAGSDAAKAIVTAASVKTPDEFDALTANGLMDAVTGTKQAGGGAIEAAEEIMDTTGGTGSRQRHGSKWTVSTDGDTTTVTSPTGFSAERTTDEDGNTTWSGTSSSGDTWSQDAEGNTTFVTEDGTTITKSADGRTILVEESDGGVGRVELDENGNIVSANFANHDVCDRCDYCEHCAIEEANRATRSKTNNNQEQRSSAGPNGDSK